MYFQVSDRRNKSQRESFHYHHITYPWWTAQCLTLLQTSFFSLKPLWLHKITIEHKFLFMSLYSLSYFSRETWQLLWHKYKYRSYASVEIPYHILPRYDHLVLEKKGCCFLKQNLWNYKMSFLWYMFWINISLYGIC